MHNQKRFPSWLRGMKCLVCTMGKLPAGTMGELPGFVQRSSAADLSCSGGRAQWHPWWCVRRCSALLVFACSSVFHPSFAVRPSRVQRGDEHGAEVWDSERWLLCAPQPAHWEVLCILGPGSGCLYHSYGVWTWVPGQAGKGTVENWSHFLQWGLLSAGVGGRAGLTWQDRCPSG